MKKVRATESTWLSVGPRSSLSAPVGSLWPSGQAPSRIGDKHWSGSRLMVLVKLSVIRKGHKVGSKSDTITIQFNLLELKRKTAVGHMLAEWDTVSIVDSVAVQAPDVLVAVGHTVTRSKCCIKVGTHQPDVADSAVPDLKLNKIKSYYSTPYH